MQKCWRLGHLCLIDKEETSIVLEAIGGRHLVWLNACMCMLVCMHEDSGITPLVFTF